MLFAALPRSIGTDPEARFDAFRLVNPDPLPVKVLEPMLILPNPDEIPPEFSVPTEVKDELTTLDPRVSLVNTVALLILYSLPVTRFMCSDDVQAAVADNHCHVLFPPAPASTVIPPVLAVALLGEETLPSSMF